MWSLTRSERWLHVVSPLFIYFTLLYLTLPYLAWLPSKLPYLASSPPVPHTLHFTGIHHLLSYTISPSIRTVTSFSKPCSSFTLVSLIPFPSKQNTLHYMLKEILFLSHYLLDEFILLFKFELVKINQFNSKQSLRFK